jgi:hypothetical protein
MHAFTDSQCCNLRETMRLSGDQKTQTGAGSLLGARAEIEQTTRMTEEHKMTAWQRWLDHPENLWLRKVIFQCHLLLGSVVGLYVMLMSLTGCVIIYRDKLSSRFIERLVDLHENLLSGQAGRVVNGFGAICLAILCLTGAIIWWPGIKHWRRSMTVKWRSHFGRFSWDVHSALGFWFFFFILMWGVSAIYFAFPQPFNTLFGWFDPNDKFTDQALLGLSNLHFGRFNPFTMALWTILGLVPAAMAGTGMFLCCHRMIYKTTNRNNLPEESPIQENGARQAAPLTDKEPLATGRRQ